MKKFALLSLVAVLAFGLAGCATSQEGWSKGLKDDRHATVCGKELALVSSPDDPNGTRSEYRIQLTWHEVERGAHPVLWAIVSEKTYEVTNISDKVVLASCDFGQSNGHVTVKFMWMDERTCEINEAKYEYDLPWDWPGRKK
ncbi:MAG: hypothetical protein Q7S83_04130 [bacterium]|nr:hypothetical protein [bacterium]